MHTTETTPELLTLFKALADRNRLKIVGFLAQRPYAVEELSSALGVGASTTSHHLSVLAKAGLVAARADGYYSVYSLQPRGLEVLAKQLLKRDTFTGFAVEESADAFERKVLATFTTRDGRIKAFPVQEKKFLVLLRYVLRDFEPGVRYAEKRVNEMLARYNEDTAMLRRALVDHHLMAREGGGGKYWRISSPPGT